MKHLDDPEEEWEKLMWSDETKNRAFGSHLHSFGGRRMSTIPRTSPKP